MFFLFCAGVVFPIDKANYVFPDEVNDNGWVNWMAGAFLTACAISQMLKICLNRKSEEDDSMKSEPMMDNINPYP